LWWEKTGVEKSWENITRRTELVASHLTTPPNESKKITAQPGSGRFVKKKNSGILGHTATKHWVVVHALGNYNPLQKFGNSAPETKDENRETLKRKRRTRTETTKSQKSIKKQEIGFKIGGKSKRNRPGNDENLVTGGSKRKSRVGVVTGDNQKHMEIGLRWQGQEMRGDRTTKPNDNKIMGQ